MQKQSGFPSQGESNPGAVQTLAPAAQVPLPVTHCPSEQISLLAHSLSAVQGPQMLSVQIGVGLSQVVGQVTKPPHPSGYSPQSAPAGHAVSGVQAQVPSAWQTCPGAPQASPSWLASATHCRVAGSQLWQAGQVGEQGQGPQSTTTPQVFTTSPHVPAHVWAREGGIQVG